MAAATTIDNTASEKLDTKGVWKGAALGGLAGAAANGALFLLSGAAGVSRVAEFIKGQPAVELMLPQVALASVVPGVAAALFAMVLNAVSKRPAKIFLGVSVGFALFSMGGPFALAGASLGLKVVLALMHVIAGVAIAGGILRYSRR